MVRILQSWEDELETLDGSLTEHRLARSRRRFSRGELSGLTRGDGWRRDGRDLDLLAFLSRFTVISVRQAARFFYDGSWETARQRVRKMVESGLLERDNSIPWAGPVVWPTIDGQRAVLGSAHPLSTGVRPKASQMLHRLLITEQAAALVTSGREVFSEREIRMFELRGPEELSDWLLDRGVVAGDGVSPGVVPTVYNEPINEAGTVIQRERWLACVTSPAGSTRRVLRYPDLIEVTDDGDLCAIEVELSDKEMSRLRGYVDGYRDSGPYIVTEDGKPKVRHRQFRYVRWLCSPSVRQQLVGHRGGVHPVSGAPALGVIRSSYGEQSNNYTGDTSSVYQRRIRNKQTGQESAAPVEFDEHGVAQGRPMSGELIPMPDDDGIAWRLNQHFMPDRMYCSIGEWGRWRDLWLEDLTEYGREPESLPFYRWIALSGNHERCLALTR